MSSAGLPRLLVSFAILYRRKPWHLDQEGPGSLSAFGGPRSPSWVRVVPLGREQGLDRADGCRSRVKRPIITETVVLATKGVDDQGMRKSRIVRVLGYVRVSTERMADEGVSLDAQREKLKAYAIALDLELVEIIEDAGESAKTLDRPGLARALAALKEGKAEGLLVPKLDRLTRSVRDLGVLIDEYFASKFALLSVSDAIDTRTAAGRLCLNIMATVSQWEREAIGERTRDALGHLKASGVRLGGEAYGWTRSEIRDEEGRRIVENVSAEREGIARILELRRSGLSMGKIAEAMTQEGRRTKEGGRWYAETVRRVLARAGTTAIAA